MDYEHHSKEEKVSYEATISKLREELEDIKSKRRQIVDYYEKDKIDTEQKVKMAIDIYSRENNTLQAAVSQKNHEIQQKNHELEKLKNEHSKCNQHSVDNKEL